MAVLRVSRSHGRCTIEADEGKFQVAAYTPADLEAAADENAERRRQQWNDGLTRERLYREAAEAMRAEGVA